MVAGLAFLTLIINGTTSGPLLKYWRMLGIPEVKQQMLIRVRDKYVRVGTG